MRIVFTALLSAALALCGCGKKKDKPNQTIEVNENVTNNTTWAGRVIVTLGDLHVRAQVDIDPCTTVEMPNRLYIEDGGAIVAHGEADCPVVFTSGQNTPAAGDWRTVVIRDTADNGNMFDNVIFEYGGGSNENMVDMDPGSGGAFTHATFRYSGGTGINVATADPTELSNLTFDEIADYPIIADLASAGVIADVTTTNVEEDFIQITNAALDTDSTLAAQTIPYELHGDLHVRAGLTVEAGADFWPAPTMRMYVEDGGSLQLLGTSSDPITMRSANNTPAAGDWRFITFRDTSDNSNSLEYVTVSHGGADGDGAIHVDTGATLSLDNATFTDNDTCDVTENGTVNATASTYTPC